MKRFWLYNLSLTFILLILFFLVNYTSGIYNLFGYCTAWAITGLLTVQFLSCLTYALARLRRHTPPAALLAVISMVSLPLSIVFLLNMITVPAC